MTCACGQELSAATAQGPGVYACSACGTVTRAAEGEPAQIASQPESMTYGDRAGEHRRMERGRYEAGVYVIFGFLLVGGAALAGVAATLEQVAKSQQWHMFLSNNGHLWAGGVFGVVFAVLVFWDRWKCTEAFASRFCCGVANISFFYVPVVAALYGLYRGVLKLFRK